MKPLRYCVIAILALFALSGPALGKPIDDKTQTAFRHVIETQLDAFQRNDEETAFAQASPAIRAQFGSAQRFMEMVRSGYSAVYRPRAYAFEPALTLGDRAAQPVRFVGPDGTSVLAIYFMEQQADGSWRIGGVELLPLAERAI